MFVEPIRNRTGWIEVISGCMFSGKTEELIRRLKRALIAKQNVEIFKPALDTRFHPRNVVSHDDSEIRSTPVEFASDILLIAENCEVVGIDEGQFFDDELIQVCERLANSGKRVVVAGLDMDYEGKPFGPMPALIAAAEYITKLHAICAKCGGIASFSFRLSQDDEKILVGEKSQYEARCRQCYQEDK